MSEVGWPWNRNSVGFCACSLLAAMHMKWAAYHLAVLFVLLAFGFAVDEILRVIKQQAEASDHQS
jgi:hypothetical protein